MKTPIARQLRTKCLLYSHSVSVGAGGDGTAARSLMGTFWGELKALPMSEGFNNGIDTSQTYDLWLRYDSALLLTKPNSVYANGAWFNINSVEEVWQHRKRWNKLRVTIDKYEEMATTTTTSTTSTTTTSTTTTTTLGALNSLYFITPTIEGGITTPHQVLQHTVPALNTVTFKTALALIPLTDWGARRGQLYIELSNNVANSYFNVKLYRYNAGGSYLLGEWEVANIAQGIPYSIDLDALTWDAWTSRSALDGLMLVMWNKGLTDQALKCDATDESSLEIEL